MYSRLAIRICIAFLLIQGFTGCASGRSSLFSRSDVFDSANLHLGDHSFPISTKNSGAQEAFNRGLTLAYAFSHMAAEKEFRKAAELDPSSAIAWWGVALVNGPHINFPLVPEKNAAVAWDALVRAQSLKGSASPLERDLIEALSTRYLEHQPKDRSSLDVAYAAAMKNLWQKYPNNADVGALYAESMMDLHPWDLFDSKGQAKEWTPEIINVLEQTIALNSNHPGAHHLYIHAVEASNTPELGIPSADVLNTLVPAASHLVHMPAHIYLRVGRLKEAAKANENAVIADNEYRKTYPNPGFYAVYMMHNKHFLTFVRMMRGQREAALRSAREMIADIQPQFLRDFGPVVDGYMAIAIEVLMRFGRWEELLKEPDFPESMPISRSIRRFARASAYTALDRSADAKREYLQFVAAVKRVPKDATFGNNQAHTLLRVARHVLDGEIAAREKRFDAAINSLTIAQKIEDQLKYDEPPDWILPVRHALGITLLNAGKAAEAEKTYREDLKKFPNNGWSLYGLSQALNKQANNDEATRIKEKFELAWIDADTKIGSSCLCQAGNHGDSKSNS